MDKTMTRFLAILIATACAVSAQTYKTVTADTNNVIRTNFTLPFQQVTFGGGASNAVPVASGGTGATNAAGALVNLLPSYTGNSNAFLALNSNATAIIWTTNTGGGGGGGDGAASRITSDGGYNVATGNGLDFTNFSTNLTGAGLVAGQGATLTGTARGASVGAGAITDGDGFAGGWSAKSYQGGGSLGRSSFSTNGGGAIGMFAVSYGGGFAGGTNAVSTNGGAAIGRLAEDKNGGGAVGRGATVAVTGSTANSGGGAVGVGATAQSGFAGGWVAWAKGVGGAAIGDDSEAREGIGGGSNAVTRDGAALGLATSSLDGAAIGANAVASATNSFQFGAGDNSTDYSMQLFDAGSVDTNEWARLASLSTYPTTNISVTGTNNTNTLVFSNGILVEVQ